MSSEDLDRPNALCTCGAPWPCNGPTWMGDHALGCIVRADGVVAWTPCGGPMHTGNADHPPADLCSDCEPRPCWTCGGIDDPATNTFCACWTDLRTMAPADVKALFAADGWDVGTDGRLSR